MLKKPSVVIIGGGTGTFTVLSSLRNRPASITSLMTMVDDGGSNRVLRDEFGLLPTSGIRLAMVALSREQPLIRKLFLYRFHQGTGISGMTFGNLFLAAMADIFGSQAKAIEETSKFLGVKGQVLPISLDDVRLVATYADGSQIVGEHLIDEPRHDGKLRITRLATKPPAKISSKAQNAILTADLVVLGPGDFYTNTISNLVVGGVIAAIQKSHARVAFITNLMTKYGEAYNYAVSDYLKDLNQYLPLSRLNYVVINNDLDYPVAALNKYRSEFARPVLDDLDHVSLPSNIKIIRTPLVSHDEVQTQKGDTLKRSMIRHDSQKLGKLLISLLK